MSGFKLLQITLFVLVLAFLALFFTYFSTDVQNTKKTTPEERALAADAEQLLLAKEKASAAAEIARLAALASSSVVKEVESTPELYIPTKTETEPEIVEYEVTFTTNWSEASSSPFWIDTAHFSKPVVWAHTQNINLLALGEIATRGIEQMAETGETTHLENELLEASRQKNIFHYNVGEKVGSDGYSQTMLLRASPAHFRATLVSMIAPSPDWFVGAIDISLKKNGQWIGELSMELPSYDAGTENGNGFSIENNATSPKEKIKALTDIPTSSLPSFASVYFKRIK